MSKKIPSDWGWDEGGKSLPYATATPPAIKWFPPKRPGLIAGIVVSGFALASV